LALRQDIAREQQVYRLAAAVATAPREAMGTTQFLSIKDRLTALGTDGSAAEMIELALALAERGTAADLGLLMELFPTDRSPELTAGQRSDVQAAAAYAALRIDRRYFGSLTALDWTVVIAYGALMLWIGWYYSTKNKTKD